MAQLSTNDAGVAVHNLTLYRGDTDMLTVAIDVDGEPMDLSTYEIVACVKASTGESFTPSCVAENNILQITFLPEHTQNAAWKIAKYDVQITKGATVKTVLCGKIKLIEDVTV